VIREEDGSPVVEIEDAGKGIFLEQLELEFRSDGVGIRARVL
jgi:hypothetical protein